MVERSDTTGFHGPTRPDPGRGRSHRSTAMTKRPLLAPLPGCLLSMSPIFPGVFVATLLDPALIAHRLTCSLPVCENEVPRIRRVAHFFVPKSPRNHWMNPPVLAFLVGLIGGGAAGRFFGCRISGLKR